ncbi:MAG: helix-turn-helix domain-containing protein [Pseudomonadota bacterium]|nr:helix-turn-helix domain-containing protein [Pseudomonadota bacterium]
MLDTPLLPNFSLRLMYDFLAREGFDPERARRIAALDRDLFSPGVAAVPGRAEIAMQRALVDVTGYRPDLWLKLGQHYGIAAFGCLGLAMVTCANLNDYFALPFRRALNYNLCAGRPLRLDGETTGVELDTSEVPPEIHDFSLMLGLGAVIRLYGEFIGRPFPFAYIRLPVPEPDYDLPALKGVPVSFGRKRMSFYWSEEASRLPFQNADPLMHRMLVEHLQTYLESYAVANDLITRVTDLIDADVANSPTVETIANKLGMTPRTLQRRLSDHEQTFRGVFERVRRNRAVNLLLSTDLPITEIAQRTGFADLTSFEHAFRRWTGDPPRRFRESAYNSAG